MGVKHVPLVGQLCKHTAKLLSAKLKTIICPQSWQMVVTEASDCSAGHSDFALLPMLSEGNNPYESCKQEQLKVQVSALEHSILPSVFLNRYLLFIS
jgi:hypothetical protein